MTEPHEAQNPAAGQDATQTGLPASRWYWWHTVGLALFVVLIVGVAVQQTMGLRVAWLVLAVSLVAFAAIAGHGIMGVWRGMFIDERNMISLSRLQMLVWTVVVLSAYGAIALARVQETPVAALDVTVPDTLWLLIGISTTSLVGSPLLKNTKRGKGSALEEQEKNEILENQRKDLSNNVTAEGRIVSKNSVDDASWSDLFTGEEVTNVAHLDLAKIQMFFFTVLLVLSYVVALWSLFADCTVSEAQPTCQVPGALPELGDGALTLLTISHGGYLVNKAVPARTA